MNSGKFIVGKFGILADEAVLSSVSFENNYTCVFIYVSLLHYCHKPSYRNIINVSLLKMSVRVVSVSVMQEFFRNGTKPSAYHLQDRGRDGMVRNLNLIIIY